MVYESVPTKIKINTFRLLENCARRMIKYENMSISHCSVINDAHLGIKENLIVRLTIFDIIFKSKESENFTS